MDPINIVNTFFCNEIEKITGIHIDSIFDKEKPADSVSEENWLHVAAKTHKFYLACAERPQDINTTVKYMVYQLGQAYLNSFVNGKCGIDAETLESPSYKDIFDKTICDVNQDYIDKEVRKLVDAANSQPSI